MMAGRDPKKPLTSLPVSANYEIGYRKPPAHTRFKPGQSGNPSGRPKGARKQQTGPSPHTERLKTIVLEEAYRTIRINDANGEIAISMAQAVIRSLAVNAAKGNQRAQRLFTELLAATERDKRRLHEEWLQTAIKYKVDWEIELDRRKQLGINAPDPIPHPDHITIDFATGGVRITGPMTKEEKPQWDRLAARKAECDQAIAEWEKLLAEIPQAPCRERILQEIEREKKIREQIARLLPDE
jgi:hypothetical protein